MTFPLFSIPSIEKALKEAGRRVSKREPRRTDADWDRRTYPCRRWFCFRRSRAYTSFRYGGKSWCWRHAPEWIEPSS